MNARKALYLAAGFTEVTGVLLVAGSLIPGAYEPLFGLLYGDSVTVDPPVRLGFGIAGALMTGWGAMIAFLTRKLDSLSPHTLGTGVALGVGAWFVLDGITSLANGAALNLAGNTLYLVILVLPALALRSRGGATQAT